MKPMGTQEQIFDNYYYLWTGNKARKSQRKRTKNSKRSVRRVERQLLKLGV